MRINQLVIFSDVAKTKNISVTAKNLFMTQPSVSQNLKALEDELGIELIKRSNKGIELTDAGKKVIEKIDKIIDDYNLFMQDINDLKDNINHLKVFYTGRLEHQIIAKAMNYIDLSELNINLVYESFKDAERRLDKNEAEIVVCPSFIYDEKYKYTKLLTRDVKVLAKKGTFAKDVIAKEEIKNKKLAILNKEKAGDHFEKQLDAFGFEKKNIVHADSIESQLILVESGKAVVLMPTRSIKNDNIQEYTVKDMDYKMDFIAMYKKTTPEIDYFLKRCKHACKEML